MSCQETYSWQITLARTAQKPGEAMAERFSRIGEPMKK